MRQERDVPTIRQIFCSKWFYLCHRVVNSTSVRKARKLDHANCPSYICLLHQSWSEPVSWLLKRFTRRLRYINYKIYRMPEKRGSCRPPVFPNPFFASPYRSHWSQRCSSSTHGFAFLLLYMYMCFRKSEASSKRQRKAIESKRKKRSVPPFFAFRVFFLTKKNSNIFEKKCYMNA